MAKAIIVQVAGIPNDVNKSLVTISLYSGTDYVSDYNVFFSFDGVTNSTTYRAALVAAILDYSTTNSLGLSDENDILWSSLPAPLSFNNTPGRSIVTGTGATGFQVSALRNSFVTYTPKITTTASIAGAAEGYVALEICATNSATAGDWKEVGRITNGQALTLALTLQSVQPVSAPLACFVPAGWYVKLRSVNTTGTPTYASVSGQEVLI